MRNTLITLGFIAAIIGCVLLAHPMFDPPNRQSTAPASSQSPDRLTDAERLYGIGRYDEAAEAFQAQLEVEPDDDRALFMAALSVHKSGDFASAVPMHRQAAKSANYRSDALYNLACAYAQLNRPNEAFATLEMAAEAGFDDYRLALQDRDLVKLHNDSRFNAYLETIGLPRIPPGLLGYWMGTWSISEPNGRPNATSIVERLEDGTLVERWRQIDGLSGENRTRLSPDETLWHHERRVDNGTVFEMTGTLKEDETLHLSGTRVSAEGVGVAVKGVVEPLPGRALRVRFFDSSTNGQESPPFLDWTYDLMPQMMPLSPNSPPPRSGNRGRNWPARL